MRRFFSRLKLAWKVFRQPHWIETFTAFEKLDKRQKSYCELMAKIDAGMEGLAKSLVPKSHYQGPAVLVTIINDGLLTDKEADQALEVFATDQRIPSGRSKNVNQKLDAHHKKFNK